MSNQPGKGRAMGRGRGRGIASQKTQANPVMSKPGAVTSAQTPAESSSESSIAPSTCWGRAIQRAAPPFKQHSEFEPLSSTGSASASSEAVIGRGGMRGRRRVNESESLVTKPESCSTKQGTFGQKINLQANYFQLMTIAANWHLYEYRVDFAPEEDRTIVRKGLLRLHREAIGAYIFDGSVLYTSSKLVQPPNKMELFSMRTSDEQKIRISIKMVGELEKGDHHYISFFNIVMRKSLDFLNLQLVGRNFFDPKNKIEVRDGSHPLELWPGYLTSIRQCEYNILMCSEISHKVMLQKTVLDILERCYEAHRDYEKFFMNEILGQVVLTGYNNNTYRIDDVDFNTRPTSSFKLKNGESITYKNYYANKYGIRIRNDSQPMLVSRSKPKDRRAGQAELIYLIPELCRITGLTDEMRSNFKTMNALATYTRLDPGARIDRLMSFNKRLLSEPKVVQNLQDWGLKLNNKLVQLSGRVIQRDRIFVANGLALTPKDNNWDSEIRSNKMLITAELKDWVVVVPRFLMAECKELVNSIMKASSGMKFRVAQPRIQEMQSDRSSVYTQTLESIMSKTSPQIIMCIVPNNDLNRYSTIKKKCCVDRPCLTQVVMKKTIMSKGRPNLTAATKIAIQMNCKLGGAPWTVEIPSGNIMVAGFDVCHDKSVRNRDFGALIASLDRHCSRYFSAVSQHNSGEELSNDLAINMAKACHKYREINGVLPSTIVFYRDGVGEGQLISVMEFEVEELKNKLALLYGGDINNVKLIFVVVTKKINTRFFYNGMNAPAGTVVDDVVTHPARYDFYLVSQSGGRGTITPSGYNIIYDSSNWGPDKIQRMTYKLTQMYYNYCGAVKVPAPCQYAHKLAALVAQAIQIPPSNQLETLLYYL